MGAAVAPWQSALVTGASGGIGEAFARALAARGVDLLLTGPPRDEARLVALAAELAARHGVRAQAVAADLAERDGPDRLHAAALALGFEPDVVVNNAGISGVGGFTAAPADVWTPIVRLNAEAVVHLTRLFVEPMIDRGAGTVVMVASTSAFQPQPYFAVYGASKAFVLSFGQALWAEARGRGVRVVTVCPGPVDASPPPDDPSARPVGVWAFLRRRFIVPGDVVEAALDAAARDRPVAVLRVPGAAPLHALLALVRSVLPSRRRLRMAERVNRWLYAGGDGAGAVIRSDIAQSRSASSGSRLSGDDAARSVPAK
ncbi:MAG TPA: SDR family NAD(P)-dependent oxidoreductase [Capillimicrobium sp.]|nr:SDR family NAD(P)-dependent oxidoreductase [Capillimicrobium sp.]